MTTNQTSICIYCGQIADTREHIPAKHFFKGSTEKNLIVVPSCKRCNSSFQKDEDFFRQFWVSMLIDRSLEATKLMENEISRSIKRTPALGWQMFRQMSLIDLVTSSGAYLGKGTAYKISEADSARIDRVVTKIVKGLFYKQFKQVIPKNWIVDIRWINPKMEKELQLQELAKTLVWNVIKVDTFAYGFNYVPESYQSIWIMDFFKVPLFYVLVLDPETAGINTSVSS